MSAKITSDRIEQPALKVIPFPRPSPRPLDYFLALFLLDVGFFFLALFLACGLRTLCSELISGLPAFSLGYTKFYLEKAWIFSPVLAALVIKRLYDRRLPFWEETREMVAAIFWGILGTYALLSLKKISHETSRLVVAFTGLGACFLLPLGRAWGKTVLHRFKRYSSAALILGTDQTARLLARALQKESYLGYRVVGFLDDNGAFYGQRLEGLKVFGPVKQMGKFVRLTGVQSVFITSKSFSPKRLAEIYAQCQRLVKEIFLVPEFFGLGMLNAELSCLFSRRIFVLRIRNNLLLPLNRFIKRLVDLSIVVFSLPLVLPLMGGLALLIKIDSPGPVFFRHRRVGEGGRPFYLWKFRTMKVESDQLLEDLLQKDPEAARIWHLYRKLPQDPRLTRVGRFLRKFSLDELPQIFNILKGEMALVGPRPVTEEECRLYYRERASFYLAVKPGLTGLWQVSGRNLLSYEERVQLDTWYVLNWSLWLDLIILVRTIGTVISQRGSF